MRILKLCDCMAGEQYNIHHCEPNPQLKNSGASRWMSGTSAEDTMAEPQ